MKKSCAIGMLTVWACWAQPTAWKTAAEAEAELEKDLHGLREAREPFPYEDPYENVVRERPSGIAISVAQLQHKIPKDARKSFERAHKLSKAGDHARAAEELEAAVQRDPKFAAAYHQLGVEYGQSGRMAESEAAIRHALDLDPNSWAAHHDLGVVQFRTGDTAAAEQSARRALEQSPESASSHLLLGYLLCLRAGTWAEGLQHVQYAARSLPKAKEYLRSLRAP